MKKILIVILAVLFIIMIESCTKDNSSLLKDDEGSEEETASVSTDIGNEDGESPDFSTTADDSGTTVATSTRPRSTGGDSWSKDYD